MASDDCKSGDTLIMGPSVDGAGSRICIRHLPDHEIELGVVRPLRDGQPIASGSEVVSLEHLGGSEYSVEHIYGGPAKVTSDAYRAGWDRIFGRGQA